MNTYFCFFVFKNSCNEKQIAFGWYVLLILRQRYQYIRNEKLDIFDLYDNRQLLNKLLAMLNHVRVIQSNCNVGNNCEDSKQITFAIEINTTKINIT